MNIHNTKGFSKGTYIASILTSRYYLDKNSLFNSIVMRLIYFQLKIYATKGYEVNNLEFKLQILITKTNILI